MAAEKDFENKVKRWLVSQGIYDLGTPSTSMSIFPPRGYFEKRWGGGMSKSGLPDLHITVNGISIDVELKAENGKPSDLQIHNIREINWTGAAAFILYPSGFEDFKEIVKGVLSCNSVIPVLNALKLAHSNIRCDTLTSLQR